MSETVIYHNPRCSKSRQTLALLRERGIEPRVVEYLEEAPDVETLRGLLAKLGMAASELVRDKDRRSLGLEAPADEAGALALLAAHPKLIERPIVVRGARARLGRPPEAVLDILD